MRRAQRVTVRRMLVAAAATVTAMASGAGATNGPMTFFDTEVGQGACGNFNKNTDFIVAVNAAMYSVDNCGRQLCISANGKSVTATVADLCPGCGGGGLDATPFLFSQFADQSLGVIQMSWHYGACDGGGGGTKPKTTSEPPPPPPEPTPTTSSEPPPPPKKKSKNEPPATTSSEQPPAQTTSASTTITSTSAATASQSPSPTSPSSSSLSSSTTSTSTSATAIGALRTYTWPLTLPTDRPPVSLRSHCMARSPRPSN